VDLFVGDLGLISASQADARWLQSGSQQSAVQNAQHLVSLRASENDPIRRYLARRGKFPWPSPFARRRLRKVKAVALVRALSK
jgi:hypothetical protein